MKKLLSISSVALFLLVGMFVATNSINTPAVSAQDNEGQSSETETHDTAEADTENNNLYSYTAQPGDSYTKIARKAVQTYGINNNVNLTQAQIIAAETFITTEAGSPSLSVGQAVVLNKEAVQSAVNKAEDLDEATQAKWQAYVKYANFNTDNVGEARS